MKTLTKSRFCPSPTGYIHLGNARTALFNALVAVRDQGVFLLRIEDTDAERSEEQYTTQLMTDLKWLHCHWQEGPEIGGRHEPYWQSQRQDIYATYYQKLLDSGHAYDCFCSEEHLALTRKIQRSQGKPPRYPGTCRALTDAEREAKFAAGAKATLRFHMPDSVKIEFIDLVKGPQSFMSDDIGDFIIRRADGWPSFMFCNAIDDSLMDVTHAIRGEDHLTNTPRQIAILNALKMRLPNYGHISLILGQDGAPLSKRNGSRSILDLQSEGYLPLAVVNYLARLGHYYENTAFMSFEELARSFEDKNLSKSPARFDPQQLEHWQKEAVMHADIQTLWAWLGSDIKALVPAEQQDEFISLIKPNILFAQEAKHWAQILFTDELVYSSEAEQVLAAADEVLFAYAIKGIQASKTNFVDLQEFIKTETGIKGKALFQPLRVALTGELHGPEMGPIVALLGPERLLQRFQRFHS